MTLQPSGPRSTVDGRPAAPLHLGVVEDLLQGSRDLDLWVAPRERGRFLRVGIVDPLDRGAGVRERPTHAVDVIVVEVRRGEDELARLHDGQRWQWAGL